MQTVSAAFTAEERDSVRYVAQNTSVSWKKSYLPTQRFITIGVSTIGGNDIIPGPASVTSAWNRYQYGDESDYVLDLGYEQQLNMPMGGMVKAQADISLDNTTGRFTPRYAGGTSELYTAILPRRPIIINSGFNVDGVGQTIPQFVGVNDKTPIVDSRSKTVQIHAVDFIDYLQNKYVDDAAMFTSIRSDQLIERLLIQAGMSTAQYDLDAGLNTINFGEFQIGDKFGDIIDKVVKAEYGSFYQSEEGKLKFENRQHWDNSPYTQVQRIISTSQVINAQNPSDDHIINVVEVKSKPRGKEPQQLVWKLSGSIELPASSTYEMFVNFDDPMLQVLTPQFYTANTASDGTGSDVTSSVTVSKFYAFARAAKITFNNATADKAYITSLYLYGRPAKVQEAIYYREQDSSSVTAYEERVYPIENEYIQDALWAQSLARNILVDFSAPQSLNMITIRAIPELQIGDLISWQGNTWTIYGKKSYISVDKGFLQDLSLLKRVVRSYFKIGISIIGGTDQIAA